MLFSTSPKGLQYNLNCIEAYCYTWRLTVYLHKTKIIIFNSKEKSIGNNVQSKHACALVNKSSSLLKLTVFKTWMDFSASVSPGFNVLAFMNISASLCPQNFSLPQIGWSTDKRPIRISLEFVWHCCWVDTEWAISWSTTQYKYILIKYNLFYFQQDKFEVHEYHAVLECIDMIHSDMMDLNNNLWNILLWAN